MLLAAIVPFVLIADDASAQGPGRNPRAPAALAGTGFTYQGQLKSGGALVNANCDFRFGLWDAASGGAQVGVTQSLTATVVNGLFTVELNASGQITTGTAFNGDARWLASAVACPSGGAIIALNPRQKLTPAPMAFALPGLYTQQNATSPNVIGGYSRNTVGPNVKGATIGGGGQNNALNTVLADYGTVSGGLDNAAEGLDSTVGGGVGNTAGNSYATVGGGEANTASNAHATIGGGTSNSASGRFATIGGGDGNYATGQNATVPGGRDNIAVTHTLAAGRRAQANHQGSFVWADCDPCAASGTTFATTADNQFLVRANGGVGVNTNSPAANTLTVGGSGLRVATNGTTLTRIQAGEATLGASGAASNVYTVTFPSTFSGAPKVLATVRNDPGYDVGDTFVVTVRKILTDKFVVNIVRVDVSGSWAQSLKLEWMAWE